MRIIQKPKLLTVCSQSGKEQRKMLSRKSTIIFIVKSLWLWTSLCIQSVTSVEGVVTYKALLFIPSQAPYDYYTKEYKKGLQLYSSGVLIMENCEELLPEHFRFVKGIVDSADLSLNISREMLQA